MINERNYKKNEKLNEYIQEIREQEWKNENIDNISKRINEWEKMRKRMKGGMKKYQWRKWIKARKKEMIKKIA